MKKFLVILMCVTFGFTLVACGDSGQKTEKEQVTVDNADTQGEETEETSSANLEEKFAIDEDTSGDPSVDLDLTALSSTMIYSEVFNMMMAPDEYEGQTIKMDGNCAVYIDEETGKKYYACVVQDATQCCSQGLEFVLSDEYDESDYPENGDEITIKGTFSTYTENDLQYITMLDSVLE